MLSITVIVFAYNEKENLAAVVKEVYNTLVSSGRQYEIVIIDDGSVDGSAEIADRLGRKYKSISVIHHQRNYGLGTAYKTAFANIRCDLVTFYSADGQFPAKIIERFLPLMDVQDMVLGYLLKRDDSLLSIAFSRLEKILFRILFGPMPKFQGVLMFRRKLLDQIGLKSGGGKAWTVLIELIIRAKRAGFKMVSVPIEVRQRISGASKVNNIPTIWANFKQILALRLNL